jgi:4-amino-4-deoxy-L-arabinose transferase-like glycosyltransferase
VDAAPGAGRRLAAWGPGVLVTVATAALLLATEPWLAIVWDEGYTLGREQRLRLWFRALADPPRFAAAWQPPGPGAELVQQAGPPPPLPNQVDTRAKLLFDPAVLAWFWPFAREEPHGHPPFYALVGLAGDLVAPGWAPLPRARLGPMLAFSLTAGALCLFVTRRWGTWPGVLAAGAWVLQPNLFALGHYAAYDALLASLWVGAILAFAAAVERPAESRLSLRESTQPTPLSRSERRQSCTVERWPRWHWAIVFGLLVGCAADTKFTGWLLPLPFLAWSLVDRNRRGLITLVVGLGVAALVLYALNPPWWTQPVAGIERFVRSSLTRDRTRPIPVLFLGQVYLTPRESLPWYNTLVWTLFVVPVGFLALAPVGVGRALHRARSEPFGLLAVGHWAFLLILRALPHTPGHDGVRQFLPAFGVLAIVAGLGAATIRDWLPRAGKPLILAALAEGALSVALLMPVPLSYYSPLVGGLPGAARLGMEPTYYWDSLTGDALDWLNAHDEGKVQFATFPTSWLYLRWTGRLRAHILPTDPDPWAWYVMQNRPGEFRFRPEQRRLAEHGRPAYVVRKQGVPLLWIFPYSELERVARAPRR